MAISLKTSLDKALQACVKGDQRSVSSPYGKAQTLPTGVGKYLPEKDQPFIRQYSELLERGLSAARSGDLMAADQLFNSSYSLLYSGNLSSEGFLLSKAGYEAAGAYLDYRHNNFDAAMSRIDEALTIEEQLEKQKKEFAPLHLHRIQLLLHSVHLNARRSHIQEAMSMSFHILNYLERKTKTIPAPSSWDSAQLVGLSQKTVADLFEGITLEIASTIAGHKTLLIEDQALDLRDLFMGAETHTRADKADSCHLSPPSHAWLRAKQAFIDDDSANFLARVEDILSEGRENAPFLWYATLVDLFAFCRQLDLPEARMVKDFVESAPPQVWKYLPKTWKQCLGSSRVPLLQ